MYLIKLGHNEGEMRPEKNAEQGNERRGGGGVKGRKGAVKESKCRAGEGRKGGGGIKGKTRSEENEKDEEA